MSKPGKVLKRICKRLKVRLTVKRNGKRVYKSVAVLKAQCAKKKKKRKKKKKVKRKFGSSFTQSTQSTQEQRPRTGYTSEEDSVHGDGGGGYELFLCPQRSELGGPCTIQGCYGDCGNNIAEESSPLVSGIGYNNFQDSLGDNNNNFEDSIDLNVYYTPGSRQNSDDDLRYLNEIRKMKRKREKYESSGFDPDGASNITSSSTSGQVFKRQKMFAAAEKKRINSLITKALLKPFCSPL